MESFFNHSSCTGIADKGVIAFAKNINSLTLLQSLTLDFSQ